MERIDKNDYPLLSEDLEQFHNALDNYYKEKTVSNYMDAEHSLYQMYYYMKQMKIVGYLTQQQFDDIIITSKKEMYSVERPITNKRNS
ncbi:MAG: hypothetical protein R3Y33_01845 [Clostridia bacterium]